MTYCSQEFSLTRFWPPTINSSPGRNMVCMLFFSPTVDGSWRIWRLMHVMTSIFVVVHPIIFHMNIFNFTFFAGQKSVSLQGLWKVKLKWETNPLIVVDNGHPSKNKVSVSMSCIYARKIKPLISHYQHVPKYNTRTIYHIIIVI